ncbi:MAG: ATP-binding protein [Patescibacteria group bacterium]
MSKEVKNSSFKPRARLLLQLGDQLIRSENIAVIELVKNAYDADAKKCEVTLRNVDVPEKAEIIIADDGIGMTPEIVKNVWLEPGADVKELILEGKNIPKDFGYTASRLPIGEKGIGRFGVHKLGNYIEMVTKNANSKNEVVVRIDWDIFKNTKYLEDASFFVEERKPEMFKNGKTGTYIHIKKIKTTWDGKLYKELHRALTSLSSPFSERSDFDVLLQLKIKDVEKQAEWTKNLLTVKDIKKKALWTLNCTISGRQITDFSYRFKPWKSMDKLSPRVIGIKSAEYEKVIKNLKNKEGQLDLGFFQIGEIKIEAYLFDLGTKILNLGLLDKEALNDFLAVNGGVRVYRDGMRIFNYGEPGDDWLNLDKTRINQPSQKIGNRNILAAVQISRSASRDLREKTNREGFVEDQAYFIFRDSIKRAIEIFGQLRNIDKEKIRELYEGSSKTEPVIYDIDELKESVHEKLDRLKPGEKNPDEFFKHKEDIKKELFGSLDRIKQQYIKTNSILLKSAGAGLSLGVVIHEIEKRIKELSQALDASNEDFNISKVRGLVKSIAKLVENYTVLIANEKKTKLDLKLIIEDAIFNTEFRLKAHKIELVKAFEKTKPVKVRCSLNTIVGVLLNIFDNSIFWLDYYEVKKKKIYIDIKKYGNDEVGLIIADNGKGFALSPTDAIQPFVSMKPGGMGLGLHIVNEMIKAYNGRLIIREYKETDGIPKDFSNGAIVELIFRREYETK